MQDVRAPGFMTTLAFLAFTSGVFIPVISRPLQPRENCTTYERFGFIVRQRTAKNGTLNEIQSLDDRVVRIVDESSGWESTVLHNQTTNSQYNSITVLISPPVKQHRFMKINGFGIYKYHRKGPYQTRIDTCDHENAVVAFPFYPAEAELMVNISEPSDDLLAVGLILISGHFIEQRKIETYHKTFNVPEPMWSQPREIGANMSCVALERSSGLLKNVSCDQELPYFCKKGEGYEEGRGYYIYQDRRGDCEDATRECRQTGDTVAYPTTAEEAYVIASHSRYLDTYLFLGLMKQETRFSNETVFRILGEQGLTEPFSNWTDYWDEGQPSDDGSCLALNVINRKLAYVNCRARLPLICKKPLYPRNESYGYGFYTYHDKREIQDQHEQCEIQERLKPIPRPVTVAYPRSSIEADIIAEHAEKAENDDQLVSVALKIINNGGKIVYVPVHDLKQEPVKIRDEVFASDEDMGNGSCLALNVNSAKLQFVDCGATLPFVCKEPVGRMESVNLSDNNTYEYVDENRLAEEVHAICVKANYSTVALPNLDLITEMKDKQLLEISVTTGLRRITKNDSDPGSDIYQRLGTDDKFAITRGWAGDKPNYDGDCVQFTTEGFFEDYDCNAELPFICVRYN